MHIAFATPYLLREIPEFEELNRSLAGIILAEKAKNPGTDVSNVGGWHSTPDLWEWNYPAIEKFKAWVHNSILRVVALPEKQTNLRKVKAEYMAAAWANVNCHGDYNLTHIHPECDWSCVYYVSTGRLEPGNDLNGKFELRDPRSLAFSSGLQGYGFGQSMIIGPEPGRMILFPAWMEHLVHPFYGDGERISIAVNIKMVT